MVKLQKELTPDPITSRGPEPDTRIRTASWNRRSQCTFHLEPRTLPTSEGHPLRSTHTSASHQDPRELALQPSRTGGARASWAPTFRCCYKTAIHWRSPTTPTCGLRQRTFQGSIRRPLMKRGRAELSSNTTTSCFFAMQ